jgi:hypothetical protein
MKKAIKKSKSERIKSAAIVVTKYQMIAGKIDDGFKTIYQGVLKDLNVTKEEVDEYINNNKNELIDICNKG